MKQIRNRLTYGNVMSTIAVFLVLGGASAFAATQLGKNSVGTKQLKKNAVTTAKIKKNAVNTARLKRNAVATAKIRANAVTGAKLQNGAVTGAKIQNNAVTGDKVADGTLTGADVNAASMPFTQVTARLRNNGPVAFVEGEPIPIGSYTQQPGEDDVYLSGFDVTFDEACTGEREAAAFLLMDPQDPTKPEIQNVVSIGAVEDESGGTVTKRIEFSDFPIGLQAGMKRMGSAAAQNHSFYLFPIEASCEGGSGISASNIGLDALGTK